MAQQLVASFALAFTAFTAACDNLTCADVEDDVQRAVNKGEECGIAEDARFAPSCDAGGPARVVCIADCMEAASCEEIEASPTGDGGCSESCG